MSSPSCMVPMNMWIEEIVKKEFRRAYNPVNTEMRRAELRLEKTSAAGLFPSLCP